MASFCTRDDEQIFSVPCSLKVGYSVHSAGLLNSSTSIKRCSCNAHPIYITT
jgi:hypothetical protein